MAGKTYALTGVKANGVRYNVGDEVPELDDTDDLVKRGVLGTAADVKALEKSDKDHISTVAALEAQVAELRAELEATQVELMRAQENTESVTDQEAAELAEAQAVEAKAEAKAAAKAEKIGS